MENNRTCTWCCKKMTEDICPSCEHSTCRNDIEHDPEWSRKTISKWECKICLRTINNSDEEAICSVCPGL